MQEEVENPNTNEIEIIQKQVETWQLLKENNLQIEKSKFDNLFEIVKTMLPDGLDYSARTAKEQQIGFLLYVQNDLLSNGKCIYNLDPEDFEINED